MSVDRERLEREKDRCGLINAQHSTKRSWAAPEGGPAVVVLDRYIVHDTVRQASELLDWQRRWSARGATVVFKEEKDRGVVVFEAVRAKS